MTVKELIDSLLKFRPDVEVVIQLYDKLGNADDRGPVESVDYDQETDEAVIK